MLISRENTKACCEFVSSGATAAQMEFGMSGRHLAGRSRACW